VDVVLALTTSDYCMLCACYEAVSSGKVLITSDKIVLKEYFCDAIFVSNESNSIANGIAQAMSNLEYYKSRVLVMANKIQHDWALTYSSLLSAVDSIKK